MNRPLPRVMKCRQAGVGNKFRGLRLVGCGPKGLHHRNDEVDKFLDPASCANRIVEQGKRSALPKPFQVIWLKPSTNDLRNCLTKGHSSVGMQPKSRSASLAGLFSFRRLSPSQPKPGNDTLTRVFIREWQPPLPRTSSSQLWQGIWLSL